MIGQQKNPLEDIMLPKEHFPYANHKSEQAFLN